jgi:type VI secretion system protein ImpJ
MFLKPHHFQQADGFQDARLAYHLRVINPFHWGVVDLAVDVDALENMLFRVVGCEAVFPDGLVVRHPADAAVESQSFQDEFPATANVLDVYLAVRTFAADAGGDRFARDFETRRDVLMPDNEAPVEVLVPRGRVVFGVGDADERLTGSQAIKIAQIRRTGRNAPRFELTRTYVPPSLSLHASAPLVALVNEVIERLCAASRTLGQHRRERGPEAIGYGVGDLEHLMARQLLNQYIPALSHALANEAVHPWAVYGLLAELHGALTSFWPEGEAWTFPTYAHDDLAGCFGGLCEKIRQLLERLLPVHYIEVPLERQNFQFSGTLTDDAFARGNAFVLAVKGDDSEERTREQVEVHGKVGSTQDIPQLVRSALRGVPLRYLALPPAEIPRYHGFLYFQVDIGDPRWAKVREAASFAFYLADAHPSIEGRLFVVLSGARERS